MVPGVWNHNGQEMPIENYCFPESAGDQITTFENLPTMLDFLSIVYGTYPFIDEKYGHAIVPQFGGAMEHQTCTTWGAAITGPDYYSTVLHELAHQWVGDLITCETWAHIWLNEGFAVYSEVLYSEYLWGNEAYHAHINAYDSGNQLDQALVRDPEGSQGHVLDWVVYAKGAWTLHMLRGIIGTDAMYQFLWDWTHTPELQYGTATTDDLIAALNQSTGMDLTWFINQWFYQEGRPQYRWCRYESETVDSLRVTLSSESVFDDTFDMPLVCKINTDEHTLFSEGGFNRYSLPAPAQIDSVLWDPENWVLDYGILEVVPAIEPPAVNRDGSITLFLDPFFDPQSPGYIIYRMGGGPDWEQLNTVPVTDFYVDDNVIAGGSYQYRVRAAADESGLFLSPSSEPVTVEAVDFTMDQGVLVVDMTYNYPESSPMPTDAMCDAFYQSMFGSYGASYWDCASQGMVPLSEMAQYSTVIAYCDDINNTPFSDNLSRVKSYLLAGGNFFLSAWRYTHQLDAQDLGDWFHITDLAINYDPDFAGATGQSGFGPLTVDPDKVGMAIWNGLLPYVNTFVPLEGAEVIYRFDSATDDPDWEDAPCGVRCDANGKLYLLCFPLYFCQQDQAQAFVNSMMSDFGVTGADDETGPGAPNALDLTVSPNPFNPEAMLRFDIAQSGPVRVDVYNIRGQHVRTLVRQNMNQGTHRVLWDGRDDHHKPVAGGLYLIRLHTPDGSLTRKAMMLK